MDKARSGFPISVTFSDGELPTAAKLSAVARQAKQGLSLLEYMIGDPWNQSGDTVLGNDSNNTLMIPNLARMLGASKWLNPIIPSLPATTVYSHIFYTGDGMVGKYEGYLSIPPYSGTSYTWSGTSAPTTQRSFLKDCTSDGDWYIDETSGYLYTTRVIQHGWRVIYRPDVRSEAPTTASFSVIPSPNTYSGFAFRGCKIQYRNGTDNSQGFIIYLPPRGPIQFPKLFRNPQSAYSPGNTFNTDTSPDVNDGNFYFWQDPSVVGASSVAAKAAHYRYNLPDSIMNNVDTGGTGVSTLPTGMLYLWDHSQTETIITGVTFTSVPSVTPIGWKIYASGAALNAWVADHYAVAYSSGDLTRLTHESADYAADGLRLIVIGNSVTEQLNALNQQFLNHDHRYNTHVMDSVGNWTHPGKPVSHEYVADNFTPVHSGSSPATVPSAWSNDWHPQYLNRYGITQNSGSTDRDKYLNGMFGDLLMLSSDNASNYINLTADSKKILFGSDVGPSLFFDYSAEMVTLSGGGLSLWSAYSDPGILKFSSYNGFTGRGAIVNCDYARNNTAGSFCVQSTHYVDSVNWTDNGAEGGAWYANTFGPGNYYDSGFGYGSSSSTTTSGYGPIRQFIIPPNSIFGGEIQDVVSSYFDNEPRVYWTNNSPPSVFTNDLIGVVGGSGYSFYAYAILPFSFMEYAIVDVHTCLYPYTSNLASGEAFCRIGITYRSPTTAGIGPTGGISRSIDLFDSFGAAAHSNWSGAQYIFGDHAASVLPAIPAYTKTGTVLQECVNDGLLNSSIFIVFQLTYLRTNSIGLGPVTVLYRVRRF